MKPMIKYRGGKSKEIPNIMWYIPRFRGRYIEPFFGGGALFFYLEPREAIINDINEKLIKFYLGVRNKYGKLRDELDEIEKLYTQYRYEFDALKAKHPDDRIETRKCTIIFAPNSMERKRNTIPTLPSTTISTRRPTPA